MFKKIPLLFLMTTIALSACGMLNVTVERTPLARFPGVDATPTSRDIIGSGPTFTPSVQPLNMDSSPDVIQQKMLHSALNWTTIWLDGINTDLTVGGNSTAREQLWIDQTGARFRFLSGPVDGEAQTLMVSDGSSKLSMDIASEVRQVSALPQGIADQFVPQLATSGTALPNPIGEQTSAWARNMVFSSYWAQSPSAGFKSVGMDRIAGRQALVIDYDALGTRMWVDVLTGIILKQQRFGEGGGSMVEEYVITKVLYDIPNLPDELFTVNPASRPVFSDVMGTPLVSVIPTLVPTTNNSEIYQVITRPNPLNDLLTDVYIQNISTQEEKLFITLDNVNTGNYHVGEYHNGNLYIIRRMGYPGENWSDELWRYDIQGKGKMLFSKKGLDFRVASNESDVTVVYQSVEDNANRIAFISNNGEVLQNINIDPIGNYLNQPDKWSYDNSQFWGELKSGPTSKYIYQITISSWGINKYDVSQLSIGEDYELNANTGKIVYSDYPFFFTVDEKQQFLNSGREVKLFLYDLNSKNLQIIATSITKPFSPIWLDNYTIEYDDPNDGTRIKYEIK